MARLFHVSEEAGIQRFEPRPSPSYFETIRGDVVFAVSEELLHNYLLPRDCPRVGFYAGTESRQEDVARFLGPGGAEYVLAIEKGWLPRVMAGTIYVYELPVEEFTLLDVCAGYHVSYSAVAPLSVRTVDDILGELLSRPVELRLVESLWPLAEAVKSSTMQFSCIRMRNASND